MQKPILTFLTDHYAIPPIQQIAPIDAGYLTQNFALYTADSGTPAYFLKQYRYTKAEPVIAAHAAKHFFASAGVPVILPIVSNSGETFLFLEGHFYSLFPYIQGRHLQRGRFSRKALISTAQMMAHIHRTGNGVTLPHVRISKPQKSYQAFVDTAEQILARIPQTGQTPFDQLAQETILLKLDLAKAHRTAIETINLPSDHLLHGDYHDLNLFFDAHDQVSHVFDWEKTKVGSRSLQLIRAIKFICFGNPDNFVAVHSDENFARARIYLQAYHEAYPITHAEIAQAITARYLQNMVSLWIEDEHYLQNNGRTDVFLEAAYASIRYSMAYRDEYIERLCIGIVK
ncbi:MAG: phosphotransferase [Chloroflexota bacterium]